MKFPRHFTTADRPVVDQIEWKTVPVQITGKVAQVPEVEVPIGWSQNAANIFADKYLRKAGVPSSTVPVSDPGVPAWLSRREAFDPGRSTLYEDSAKQVFNRMAGAWTYWGWREGYFGKTYNNSTRVDAQVLIPVVEDLAARAFYDEIYYMLAMQIAAPNSPQWFNTGLHWAYGIAGPDSGMWRVDPKDKSGSPVAVRVYNSYENPQPHACFLTPTTDDLVNEGGIMDTAVREARIFKHGSGSGINASAWRAKGERLSGGGVASGVMSWLRILDSAAGAIQSGGTTRRAAKMVLLDDDHPELCEFISWKVREEGKAAAMDVGSQLLRNYYMDVGDARNDPFIAVSQPILDRLDKGFEPEALPASWESEGMRTIDGQNSNNSVRVTDKFMRATEIGEPWNLTARTTGEVMKTVNASQVWNDLCRAAWACADPGLVFHDIINSWNTCPNDDEIKTCNPCAEYNFLDGTACLLASLRLTAFLRDDGTIDLDAYEHVVRLWTIVLDISISMAGFPAQVFAEGAYNYRTLGLGYADLGGLLMRMAMPYDSDEGRALAAGLTALMTGISYLTSAELAEDLGPFPRWEANAEPMKRVLRNHAQALAQNMGLLPVEFEGLNITPYKPNSPQFGDGSIHQRAKAVWLAVMVAKSFRNAQTTLIAPTGTISFVMDADTTGCEPDYALVKHKNLAGGGTMKIVNQAVPVALRRLDYSEPAIEEMIRYIADNGSLNGYDVASSRTHDVFACVAELRPMAHVLMVAAIQPFLSGAASKTVNLPNDATVEDVSHVYREAHRLGIKAIALYRDGSKLTQPLAAASPKPLAATTGAQIYDALTTALKIGMRLDNIALPRGNREPLPSRRKGETQKARVGGQTVYWRTGEYPDGRLGELFIDLAGAGSTLDGFANALAKMTSIALQFGAPLGEVVDSLLGVRFEPAGHVELHDRIKWCASIPDLIARDLAIAYQGRDDLANVVRAVALDAPDQIVALDKRGIAVAVGVPTGEICQRCGGVMVQSGSCKTCVDCGESLGGCG